MYWLSDKTPPSFPLYAPRRLCHSSSAQLADEESPSYLLSSLILLVSMDYLISDGAFNKVKASLIPYPVQEDIRHTCFLKEFQLLVDHPDPCLVQTGFLLVKVQLLVKEVIAGDLSLAVSFLE